MRILFGSIALLAIMTLSVAASQEPPASPDAPKQPPPVAKVPPTPVKPLPFDHEAFLRDHDKNRDGYLQAEELPSEYRGAFARMDTNRDGKLSRDELLNGAAYLQPRRRSSDFVYMMIEMSDLDDDSPIEVQRAYDILRGLDKNRDGKIDAEELKTGRERIVSNRVDYLFGQLDANKDGRISRAEARGMVRQNFPQIDRNRDGFIEREELRQAILEKPSVGTSAPAPAATARPIPPAAPRDR
jgi:Ca2+-binding EF-hand superfamily protein